MRIEKLRADGFDDWRALYVEHSLAHDRSIVLAKIEKLHEEMSRLQMPLAPSQLETAFRRGDTGGRVAAHPRRDRKGHVTSADHEFVSAATAYYGATDYEIMDALTPGIFKRSDEEIGKEKKRVEKMRERCHELRMPVIFDCGGCVAHPDRAPKSRAV